MRSLVVLLLLAAYIRGAAMGKYIALTRLLDTSFEWVHANEVADLNLWQLDLEDN
jgi:hypothetical protein